MNRLPLIMLIALLLLTACSKQTYGIEIKEANVTQINQALNLKDSTDTLRLEGKIGAVCPTGCWFYLEDNSGEIYVDLAPSGIAIPQSTGKKAVVEGSYIKVKENSVFVAKGVEIK
ncbi:MAG: hypothetical protein RAO94_14100 [Candidatus Stygibacter australis]|nr:hypothetical protein [Candidatus Stygibacter australis]